MLRNALVIKRLSAMNGIDMPEEFDQLIRRALEFTLHIHRPDGMIPSLSDGDTGSFLPLLREGHEHYGDERYLWVATQGQAGRPPQARAIAFPHGGYYILRSGWGEVERYRDERFLVFDCGPLGEGNHGHLDLLSLELYGYGRPLIVDPGRYTYDESGDVNWRALFRGTAYHNTVTVDGRNQSRYEFHKRKFKIRGPAPEFQLLSMVDRPGYCCVRGRAASAEYDAIHEREIRLIEGRRVVVIDELSSPTEHRYDQIFHLAPDSQGRVRVGVNVVEAPHLRITQLPQVSCSVEEGFVSELYGTKLPAPILRFSLIGRSVRFETHLEVLP